MRLKNKQQNKQRNLPNNTHASSYPEAEAGVEIYGPAMRAALRRECPAKSPKSRKPIISINGHDVDKIPDEIPEKIPGKKDHAA